MEDKTKMLTIFCYVYTTYMYFLPSPAPQYPPYVMLGQNCSRGAQGLVTDHKVYNNPQCLTQRPP